MTKLYTLAQDTHVVAGHGDSFTAQRICKEGSYEEGEFPPVFITREAAEEHVTTLPEWRQSRLSVVTLNLIT